MVVANGHDHVKNCDHGNAIKSITQRRKVSQGLGKGRRQPAKQPKWKQQQEHPSLWWALARSLNQEEEHDKDEDHIEGAEYDEDGEHDEGAEYDKDAEGEKQGDFTIWRKHHDMIDNWKCKQQNWQNKISLRYGTCWKNFDNWI